MEQHEELVEKTKLLAQFCQDNGVILEGFISLRGGGSGGVLSGWPTKERQVDYLKKCFIASPMATEVYAKAIWESSKVVSPEVVEEFNHDLEEIQAMKAPLTKENLIINLNKHKQ